MNNSRFDMVSAINSVAKNLAKLENYKRYCEEQRNQLEAGLRDLDHSLELCNLNCVAQAKVSKARKELLHRRRFYKDELEYIKALENSNVNTQILANSLKSLKSIIEDKQTQLGNRQYTPRFLFEFFNINEDEVKELIERKRDKDLLGKSATKQKLDLEKSFRKIHK